MIFQYKNTPIYYTDDGQGAAVVLLHGFLETSAIWKDLVSEIKTSHRVITLDLLGHGKTGCIGYIHTMEMMAETVISVLNHLKIKKSIFIGHSMGGYVALALAEDFPERIDGFCLMNSTPFADSTEKQVFRDRAINVVKQNHKAFVRMSISNLFNSQSETQFYEAIESLNKEAMNLPVQGIVAALEGMKIRKDRSLVLKKLKTSKLIILGLKDTVLEFDNLNTQLTELEVRIVKLPGGHISYIEDKIELTYILKHFIEN